MNGNNENDKVMTVNVGDEDEDIKVFGASPHPSDLPGKTEEDEARRFLLHKSSGNIEKAREAGIAFARAIADSGSDAGSRAGSDVTMLETHHRILLCSYIVNIVIVEKSPDNILAQTSLGAFYGEIETNLPNLYQHVSDMAAFSLYMLSSRSTGHGKTEIGRIYARLCGFDGVQEKIDEGNRISENFHGFCSGIIEKAGYIGN